MIGVVLAQRAPKARVGALRAVGGLAVRTGTRTLPRLREADVDALRRPGPDRERHGSQVALSAQETMGGR